MFIKSITLHNLVAFQCAQIKTLTLTCTDLFQLILGTNGSGKSSLLNQLNPLPAVSTDFLKGGWKELEIDHKGKHYRLISDFRKKGNSHEFWLENENLNEGGTSDVQKELVLSHFNWTNEVQQLCYNTLPFCTLGPSQRESFFMNINPDQISFILDKNKKTKSLITVTKGILNNLTERKLKLEGEMLEKEKIKELQQEQESLHQEGLTLYKELCVLERELNSIPHYENSFKEELEKVSNTISLLLEKDESSLSKEELEKKKIQTDLLYDTHVNKLIPPLEKKCIHLREMIEKEKNLLEEYKGQSDKNYLQSQVEMLESSLEEEEKRSMSSYPHFSQELLKDESFLPSFLNVLSTFTQFESPLYSRKKIGLKLSHYTYWERRLTSLLELSDTLEEEYLSLLSQRKYKKEDLPTSCEKGKCFLYEAFITSYSSLEKKIEEVKEKKEDLLKKINRLSVWIERQMEQNVLLEQTRICLSELKKLTEKYPETLIFFKGENTSRLLGTNPMVFYHRLQHHREASVSFYHKEEIKKSLYEEKIKLEKVKSNVSELIHSTESKIEALEKEWEDEYIRYTSLVENKEKFEKENEELKEKIERKQKIEDLKSYHEELLLKQEMYERYQEGRKKEKEYKEKQQQNHIRHGEISSLLKTQEGIRERYEKEIIGQIETQENLLKDLTIIKEALSLIPKKRMNRFLNKIIKKVNSTIAQVFTYEFKLEKIEEEEMNFKFPYTANNSLAKDISTCSTAQKEITQLAFTLICREIMGINDYPLFLDEVGKTFDMTHQRRLLDFLLYILDEGKASQIFIVNHHSLIHSGINNAEVLVLHEANVLKPERYNEHVLIESY